jgi:hypothetical protein
MLTARHTPAGRDATSRRDADADADVDGKEQAAVAAASPRLELLP